MRFKMPQADVQEKPQEMDVDPSKMSRKEKQKQLQDMYLNSNKRYFEILTMTIFFILWPMSFYYNIILRTDTLCCWVVCCFLFDWYGYG